MYDEQLLCVPSDCKFVIAWLEGDVSCAWEARSAAAGRGKLRVRFRTEAESMAKFRCPVLEMLLVLVFFLSLAVCGLIFWVFF